MVICPRCGRETPATTAHCEFCGADLLQRAGASGEDSFSASPYAPPFVQSQPTPPGSNDSALRWLIPVGRSPYAVAAGYTGLLSPVFCFLGPFAIALGILAIRDLQRNPQLCGLPRAILGIVLGSVGCLLLLLTIAGMFLG